MTRKKILLLILADLIVLAVSGYWIWDRYQILRGEMRAPQEDGPSAPVSGAPAPSSPSAGPVAAAVSTPAVPAPAPTEAVPAGPPAAAVSTPAPAEPPAPPKPNKKRKFRRSFVFVSSTATTVQLVGDFNKWKPQALRKGEGGKWKAVVSMPAGDYSYNFIVDGKTIRDPNQRRTDAQGRSLLTVAP